MGEEVKGGSRPGPQDPCNMVYAIFVWLGIGTLLPWNMFITVSTVIAHTLEHVSYGKLLYWHTLPLNMFYYDKACIGTLL